MEKDKVIKPKTTKVATKNAPVAKKAAPEHVAKSATRYFEGVGGRKTATARARITPDSEQFSFLINGKNYSDYFVIENYRRSVLEPLKGLHLMDKKLGVSIHVGGGGLTGQAEAIRHAISRALVKYNPEFRKPLRVLGFLTRDARSVERKKYGLTKARRAPQWAKR